MVGVYPWPLVLLPEELLGSICTGTSPNTDLNASPDAPDSHKIIVKLYFVMKPPLSWVIFKRVQKLSQVHRRHDCTEDMTAHHLVRWSCYRSTGRSEVQTRSSSWFGPLPTDKDGEN